MIHLVSRISYPTKGASCLIGLDRRETYVDLPSYPDIIATREEMEIVTDLPRWDFHLVGGFNPLEKY